MFLSKGKPVMDLPIFQIDAFTLQDSDVLSGNPAAVIPLKNWLADDVMQMIATENNLSETTFFVKEGNTYHLRWFTPSNEVDLCGHATLAAAHVIHQILGDERTELPMTCATGAINVGVIEADNGFRYRLEFPNRSPKPLTGKRVQNKISKLLGVNVLELHQARDLVAILENEQAVQQCQPDFAALKDHECFALTVTAESDRNEIDFVSRFFAPKQGINEDPVTGSSFCTLGPLWSEKMQKTRLIAQQLSSRGGNIEVEVGEQIVGITGTTYHFMQGVIRVS